MVRNAILVLAGLVAAAPAGAQPSPGSGAAPAPLFAAGQPLGIIVEGRYTPMSANVKVYGAVVSAESCSWHPGLKKIMVVNRGALQTEAPNDGFVSLLNSDGSVHTARWIGETRNGLVLNHPFGSDVHAGKLYLADSDGGTRDGAARVAVLRMFDLATGAPSGEVRIEQSQWLNDIAVAADGTVYGTQTGTPDGATPMRLYRISPAGEAMVLIDGAPLANPNGVAIDNDGNVVVVNIGNHDVMTFSPDGKLLKTEKAAQAGNDGLVIMKDGTKYVSSVRNGGISRIRPGRAADLIATGIPSAASMCHDPVANQLVIPMNPNNGVAFVKLR